MNSSMCSNVCTIIRSENASEAQSGVKKVYKKRPGASEKTDIVVPFLPENVRSINTTA